jgi:hypothetical protein
MYSAKIVADSIHKGVRLTTVEATFARSLLAEVNTHRRFSRLGASSRAIPVQTRAEQVLKNPYIPPFSKNKRGMQADEMLSELDDQRAEEIWRRIANACAEGALELAGIEVHKQEANRVLEAFAWHTALITATHWDNFFALRMHKAAAPGMQALARAIKDAMDASTPTELPVGCWHLPYVHEREAEEIIEASWTEGGREPVSASLAVSVARCAAISYERQNVVKALPEYFKLHDTLRGNGHMSPFENQVKVATPEEILEHASFRWNKEKLAFEARDIGNFAVPWLQYRKLIPGEDVFSG